MTAGPTHLSADSESALRQVLGAFYKTVDVMKSARNSEKKLMSVWPDDMKAVEYVILFLENLRDQSSDGGVESRHAGDATQTTGSAVPGAPLTSGDTISPIGLLAAGAAPGPSDTDTSGPLPGSFAAVVIKRMTGLIETANKDSKWEMEAVAEMMKAVHLITGVAQGVGHCGELTQESLAKATKGKAGTAVGLPHVRGSTTGTGLQVGAADAVQSATSEIMALHEQVFADICTELGCPMDNEAVLEAIATLKKRARLGSNGKSKDVTAPLEPIAGASTHASDCALHNAPALPVGPCDCGVSEAALPTNSHDPQGVISDGSKPDTEMQGRLPREASTVSSQHGASHD